MDIPACIPSCTPFVQFGYTLERRRLEIAKPVMYYNLKMTKNILHPDAAADFEFLCWVQMKMGIISRFEYLDRYYVLQDLLDPNSDWRLEGIEVEADEEADEYSSEMAYDYDEDYLPYGVPTPVLNFMIKTPNMPIKCWVFHQSDDDHFPSVPHGHDNDDNRNKLDVYQGYIYDRNRRVFKRANRKSIIALWNDNKFRIFAIKALQYFESEHPVGLIGHPAFPLPKKRKR